ncbi:MAG: hypothetical protein FJ095_12435 [Deltaproteobacteria bacterium]|nr:hypothetical protein [Deltaproteobacteria bacterium]
MRFWVRMAATSFVVAWSSTAGAQPMAPGAPPGAPAPAQGAPNLPSSGGLTAPAPLEDAEASSSGNASSSLAASEAADSGRGLTWFWLDAEGGFQHVGLETFDVDKSNLTAGLVPTEASGAFVSAGLGVQLLFLRIGPRGRVGFFDDWRMYSVGGELGLRLPLGFLEPHAELGGGYVAFGSLADSPFNVLADKAQIHGGYGRVSGGLDFYLGKVFALGPFASWEFMGLTRPGVALSDLDPTRVGSLSDAQKTAAALEGSGYGSSVSVGGRVGLNF